MKPHHHRRTIRATRGVVVSVVVLVAAAGTALAATAQSKHPAKGNPGGQVAKLQHQVAGLRKQNHALQAFTPAGITAQMARTKAALDKYQSVDAAKAAGYAAGSPCESTPIDKEMTSYGGTMGIHYVNPSLMAPGPIVPAKPPILVYVPTAGGGLQLVAAEYFKPDADQDVKTDNDRPSLFGRAFDGPMLGHAPGMPIHYDLHVWLWQHNPSGTFAPFNPAAHC